ncbi:MAG: sulfotransferase domain-containing protein [Arenimonas sp.]
MNSPDFLIIGAQKCGTSWLHRQLRQHPGVFMPADKDAPFFFNDAQDAQGFLKRFENAPVGSLVGDACASYFWTRNTGPYPPMFNQDISSAIRQYLGNNLKLIVMLKDPVQRSVSAYLHHIAHGSLDISCSILDASKELGIISLSRYSQHLKHWCEDYANDRLLILPAPDSLNGEFILNKTGEFLDLSVDFQFQGTEEKVFEGLERKQLEGGIWVAIPQKNLLPDAKTSDFPSLEIDGKRFIRLIQAYELEALANDLFEDLALFRGLFGVYASHDAAHRTSVS